MAPILPYLLALHICASSAIEEINRECSIPAGDDVELEDVVQFIQRKLSITPTTNTATDEHVRKFGASSTVTSLAADLPKPYADVHLPGEHVVDHLPILNSAAFWVLMGAQILVIAVGVVHVQIDDSTKHSQGVRHDLSFIPKMWLLFFCTAGLTVSMAVAGIAQEYLTTNLYAGELFPSTAFLILCNRFCTSCLTGCVLMLLGKPLHFDGFAYASLAAIPNSLASTCQYASLHYVSFLLLSIAKPAKLVVVVVFSTLRGKRYGGVDWMEFVFITIGLMVFSYETADIQEWETNCQIGIALICASVVFDSCTPHLQDSCFINYPNVGSLQASFAMSVVACGGLLLYLLPSGNMYTCVAFILAKEQVLLHVVVLAMASTTTQILLIFTVKQFGPVVCALVVAFRIVFSVLLSDLFFQHNLSLLAIVALVTVAATTAVRAFRPAMGQDTDAPAAIIHATPASTLEDRFRQFIDSHGLFFVCAVAIHVIYGFYGVAQEFLATHTFDGKVFNFPVFIVAVTHTSGTIFAMVAMYVHRVGFCAPGMAWTVLPATSNVISTVCQHTALFYIYFPIQSLVKTLRIIPVMLIGRLLKNRTYTAQDYFQALGISALVGIFVWQFESHQMNDGVPNFTSANVSFGLGMMLVYICLDPLTSNLEDYVYQASNLDPSAMLLGVEATSAAIAWMLVIFNESLTSIHAFLCANHAVFLYLTVIAVAASAGAYTCILTIRLFNPAVFTLLMMSRQVMSIGLSLIVFGHSISLRTSLSLLFICVLILCCSYRHVPTQQQIPPCTTDCS